MPAITLPSVAPKLLLVPYQSAAWILEHVERGGRVVALTKGHLSLTDIVHAALDKTGPARVTMAVWGASWEELSKLKALCDAGTITALRLILPHAGKKHARDVDTVREMFGAANVVMSATHAKIATIEGNGWSLAIRGSMNMYACNHAEQLDIDDSPAICAAVAAYATTPQEQSRYPRPEEDIANARRAVAELQPGGRIFGITEHFSLPALVRAIEERTGPARVSVVTARLGKKDAASFVQHPSIRFVLGQSVVGLGKAEALDLQTALGAERIRVALVHAKLVTIRNDAWSVSIRSSMNLCANLRAEQFDVTDDAAIADQIDGWIDFIFEETPAGIATANTTQGAVYRRSLNDETAVEREDRAGRWARSPEPFDLSRFPRSAGDLATEHGAPPFRSPQPTPAAAPIQPRPAPAPLDLSRYAQQPLPFTR